MKNILKINTRLFFLLALLWSCLTVQAQYGENGEVPFDFKGQNDLASVDIPGRPSSNNWNLDWNNYPNANNNYEYWANTIGKDSDDGSGGAATSNANKPKNSVIVLTKKVKPGQTHIQAIKGIRSETNRLASFVSQIIVNGQVIGNITFSDVAKINGVDMYTKLTVEVYSDSPISISSITPFENEDNRDQTKILPGKEDYGIHQVIVGDLKNYENLGLIEFNVPFNESEDINIKGTTSNNSSNTKDPCITAYELTALAEKQTFQKAVADIKAAAQIDGLEHSITLGKTNGQITTSPMVEGKPGEVAVSFNWLGAFTVLHNHPNSTPPSGGDIYAITRLNKNNSNFYSCFAIASGEMYAIAITDLAAAQIFSAKYLTNRPPGDDGEYPEFMTNEMIDAFNEMNSYNLESQAKAKAFVLTKYNSGITFFKQDSRGIFYPLITKEIKNANGTRMFNLIPCT